MVNISVRSSPVRSGRFRRIVLALPLLISAAAPAAATAQSFWGFSASFTPKWTDYEQIRKQVLIDGEGTLEGTQFSVGVVRGSTAGGDWGVSFVNMPVSDDSQILDISDCEPSPCDPVTERIRPRSLYLRGVEFHWAPSFVTIKDRVQIGINIGGGFAKTYGNVESTLTFPRIVISTNPLIVIPEMVQTDIVPAVEIFREYSPLIKAEALANVIVAPGLKIRVAGGLNAPGIGIRIGMVYLIGAD
jgi:hypothetical protein